MSEILIYHMKKRAQTEGVGKQDCWGNYNGPGRRKKGGKWRKLHNKKLLNFFLSDVWMIIARRMKRSGHVSRIGRRVKGSAYRILVRTSQWNSPFRRPRRRWEYDNKVNLKCGGPWTELIWLRTETGGGLCEHGNEQTVSTKYGEFLN